MPATLEVARPRIDNAAGIIVSAGEVDNLARLEDRLITADVVVNLQYTRVDSAKCEKSISRTDLSAEALVEVYSWYRQYLGCGIKFINRREGRRLMSDD